MDNCGICLETMYDPFYFQCNHSFHNKCVSQWLIQNNTCPLCRHEIYETTESDEDEYDEDISYDFILTNRLTTLEDSVITKMTRRIEDLTNHLESDMPLKYLWEIDENGSIFNIINTKKYRCIFQYDLFENTNTIYISVDINIICKMYTSPQRLVTHCYEKWRSHRHINKRKSKTVYL